MKKLYIVGSGGFSKQVIEIIEELNKIQPRYHLMGLIDDDKNKLGKKVLGYSIIGTTDNLKNMAEKEELFGVIAIADSTIRNELANKLKLIKWVNLIHPNATVSKYLKLGSGNIICAGTVINPECDIGNHCHININCSLGHDVRINDFGTIMPGSNISGNVHINSKVMIGTGAIILQELNIEKNVTVGAGATVINDIKDSGVYIGTPAQRIISKGG